jgi:hypothetical protein
MFNIILGIYIIVAIFLIGGGTFQLYSSSQSIAALLFFIGSLVSFIIFGIKWFSQKDSIFSKTPVSWPPTINTCPDYLVYYQRQKDDGTQEDTCIDRLGISKNSSLKVFPQDGDVPTSDDYYFSITTTTTELSQRKKELCQRAIAAGLTWEGITNGESCTVSENSGGMNQGNGGTNGNGSC